ncbi:MAG: DUF721 domain-containing protein [Planctomycetota bacterium]|nr:DUF721 domain-containing protein [Planctomycetota bacterium]
MNEPRKPDALGDILKQVIRKEGLGKKQLEGRRLARKVLHETLGAEVGAHADVASVKTGVITIEADSAALFQELEGYRREELAEAFKRAGLKVREVRVRLALSPPGRGSSTA